MLHSSVDHYLHHRYKRGNFGGYLPLDRLVQQGGSTAGVSQDNIRNIADSIVRELNDRISSGRVRDTR